MYLKFVYTWFEWFNMRTAKLWTFMIICVYIYCIPKDLIIGIQQNRSARDLCTCHSPIGGLCNALISMTVFRHFYYSIQISANYVSEPKPSLLTFSYARASIFYWKSEVNNHDGSPVYDRTDHVHKNEKNGKWMDMRRGLPGLHWMRNSLVYKPMAIIS